MSYQVTEGSATDVGRVRDGNEDSMLVRPPLYVVADGMGGHLGGEVASALAITALAEHVERNGPSSLADAVTEANLAVYEKQKLDSSLAGMGTTLTAALIDDDGLHLAHVGDSRAYLIRGDAFRMLTDDHTMVGELTRAKRLSPEEARVHPQRSMLTRALGIDRNVDVDKGVVRLEDGDRLVLCTDGLNALLTDAEIEEIARAGAPTAAAHSLVDAANLAGGPDNTTVIVLDIAVVDSGGAHTAGYATMLPPVQLDELQAPKGSAPAEPTPSSAPADDERPTKAGVLRKPDAPGPEAVAGAASGAATVSTSIDTPLTTKRDAPSGTAAAERSFTASDLLPLWRSRLVIVSAIILLVALIGIRIYAYSHTYIGVSGGRVAIFHGLPGSFLGIPLSSVSEMTELTPTDVERIPGFLATGVEKGILVEDEQQAQEIIAYYRGIFVHPEDAPSPTPAPVIPAPAPAPVAVPVPVTSPSATLSPSTSPSATPSTGASTSVAPAAAGPAVSSPSASLTP